MLTITDKSHKTSYDRSTVFGSKRPVYEEVKQNDVIKSCYEIINGTAPQYLAELVQICVPSRSLCSSYSYTCQPIQFTSIKYFFFHYFGGIWPYWKMDTGKHNFHEILLLF